MLRRQGKAGLKTHAHYGNDGVWSGRVPVLVRPKTRMLPYGLRGLRRAPGCHCRVCRDQIPQARARFKRDTAKLIAEW